MRKTLLSLLFAGALALFSPNAGAQDISNKIDPDKQPNQSTQLVWDTSLARIQRENLLKDAINLDSTDYHPNGPNWNCEDFSRQLHLNFYGMKGDTLSPEDTSFKYATKDIGKFNIPLYYVIIVGKHALNAAFTGNNLSKGDITKRNVLDFYDWCFIEPQTDDINVQPGQKLGTKDNSISIPVNSTLQIIDLTWKKIGGIMGTEENPFLTFNIDSTGKATLVSYDTTRLVIKRDTTTGVEKIAETAEGFALSQNYPNPFNPATKIRYNLSKKSDVSLKIYDVLGREIETLVDGNYSAGEYEADFNASKLASGVYFYRLQAGNFVETKKMVVNK